MWEEGSFGFRGMEVRLCHQILSQVASAGGEAPVELVSIHTLQLGGGVITLTARGKEGECGEGKGGERGRVGRSIGE